VRDLLAIGDHRDFDAGSDERSFADPARDKIKGGIAVDSVWPTAHHRGRREWRRVRGRVEAMRRSATHPCGEPRCACEIRHRTVRLSQIQELPCRVGQRRDHAYYAGDRVWDARVESRESRVDAIKKRWTRDRRGGVHHGRCHSRERQDTTAIACLAQQRIGVTLRAMDGSAPGGKRGPRAPAHRVESTDIYR
jgi:hypothetical protein